MISQDTSAYGSDLRYRSVEWRGQSIQTRFIDMARALGDLGVWVRFHYVYPYPHVDEVIPLMAADKVLPYLDIPFQHASPTVLKRMRRPAHAEDTLRRIHSWRLECPELTLRSTFIVGFPGESAADFEEKFWAGPLAALQVTAYCATRNGAGETAVSALRVTVVAAAFLPGDVVRYFAKHTAIDVRPTSLPSVIK